MKKTKINETEREPIIKNNVIVDINRELGRVIAGSYYDHQEVRITEQNRIRDIIRRKIEGIPMVNVVEDTKLEEDKYQDKYKDSEIPELLSGLVSEGKLTEKERLHITKVLELQRTAEKYEEMYKKLMMEFVEEEEIYNKFLKHIKGISGVLSANLLKEYGYCEKMPYISSIHAYSGYHVVNGEAPKRKKGQQLTFSLKLRTLGYKIGDSFVKQRTPFYREIYDKEKDRQKQLMELGGDNAPKSLMHCELRARRKMIKIFLAHYWMCCRELRPQPQYEHLSQKPYVEEKLGHSHIISWTEAVKQNLDYREEKDLLNSNKVKKVRIRVKKG